MASNDYKPGGKRGPKRRLVTDDHDRMSRDDWQLGGRDYALVWRGGESLLVPLASATREELASGIASIEALACYVLDSFLRSKQARLTPDRRQDAIAHLIEQAWIEARRFNGKGRLGGFVTARLRWRLLDWYRVEFERRDDVEVLSMNVDDADVRRAELREERRRHEGMVWTTGDTAAIDRSIEARDDALRVESNGHHSASINRDALSVAALYALDYVAQPLADGHSMAHVCRVTKMSRAFVAGLLDDLRCELRAQGVVE